MKFLYVAVVQFIMELVFDYNIDDSHGLRHSLATMGNAHLLYEAEVVQNPWLKEYEDVIYVSALVHDICDTKYVGKEESVSRIIYNLKPIMPLSQINDVIKIITTMSYSYVRKNGLPTNYGKLELAYNIVREADLMEGYDATRGISYALSQIKPVQKNITLAIKDTLNLFDTRVLQHNKDKLFVTPTGKMISSIMDVFTKTYLTNWKKINEL